MPKLPSGTEQLNITGVSHEIADEFKKLCIDERGRKIPQWLVFEKIFAEWKKSGGGPLATTRTTKPAEAPGGEKKIREIGIRKS